MVLVSKIAELLILPSMLLTLAWLVGVLMMMRWPRQGRILALGSLTILLLIGLLPVGEALIRPLEERFPGPERAILQDVHAAVLLGGVVQPRLMQGNRPLALGDAAERLVEFDRLSLLEPDLPLVISGGSGALWDKKAEAPLIRDWLVAGGLAASRVRVEADSRNTWENAQNTLAMLAPTLPRDRDITVLIVTSAAHMPRAVGVFRQVAAEQGLDHIRFAVWPVDYRSSPITVLRLQRFGDGLANIDHAMREWIALTVYFWLGRTDAWWPTPVIRSEMTPS